MSDVTEAGRLRREERAPMGATRATISGCSGFLEIEREIEGGEVNVSKKDCNALETGWRSVQGVGSKCMILAEVGFAKACE
jgi:hypothetical protein